MLLERRDELGNGMGTVLAFGHGIPRAMIDKDQHFEALVICTETRTRTHMTRSWVDGNSV